MLVEVEVEVVKVDPPVDEAVETEAEARVVAEAPAAVAVTVTGMNAPGNSVNATIVELSVEMPPSFKLKLQEADLASYLQFSDTVL